MCCHMDDITRWTPETESVASEPSREERSPDEETADADAELLKLDDD